MLAIFLLASSAVTLSVDAGQDTAALESMIRSEIADATITSSSAAQIRVVLAREGEIFRVDVSGPEGQMGERTLPESEGIEPALRIATLLASRAVEAVRSLEEPLEIPPPPSDVSWYASVELISAWWSEPSTPTLGFGVGAGIDLQTFHAGLLFAELGQPCCERNVPRISGEDARELLFLADASFSPVRWGRLWIHVRAGAGINWVTVRARPRINVLEVPDMEIATTRRSKIEGAFRGGVSADMEIAASRAWFGLGTGVWWRVMPFRVMNIDGDQLYTGDLSPFIEARIRARF